MKIYLSLKKKKMIQTLKIIIYYLQFDKKNFFQFFIKNFKKQLNSIYKGTKVNPLLNNFEINDIYSYLYPLSKWEKIRNFIRLIDIIQAKNLLINMI